MPKILKCKTMKVVISTPSLNSYGSRVLTDGIDCEQYKKNPLVLWMHARPVYGTKEEVLPIGKMENVRIEGNQLVGDIVFDEDDEFARRIKSKFEKGILNMVSAGLDITELSDAPEVLLPGQTRRTVTKSKLREVSCVDIGSNDDSLVLYRNEEIVDMSKKESVNEIIPLLKGKETEHKNNIEMKEVLKTLNLAEGASEQDAVRAIAELQMRAEKGEEMERLIEQQKESRIKSMVDAAVKDKRIQADKREVFMQVGKNNGVEALEEVLSQMTAVPDVQKEIHHAGKTDIECSAEMWDRLDKEGGLLDLRMKDEAKFNKLFELKFGKKISDK